MHCLSCLIHVTETFPLKYKYLFMGKHSDNVNKNKHLVRKLREQSLPRALKVNTNQAFPAHHYRIIES